MCADSLTLWFGKGLIELLSIFAFTLYTVFHLTVGSIFCWYMQMQGSVPCQARKGFCITCARGSDKNVDLSYVIYHQVKDILKGSLRFNQSLLEAEENEEITITDDHYCSNLQRKDERDGLAKEMREAQCHKKVHLLEVTSVSLNTIMCCQFVFILVQNTLTVNRFSSTQPSSKMHNVIYKYRAQNVKP